MAIRFPKPGERVKFQDGNDVREGICNGKPFHGLSSNPEVASHLPVHVPATNENIMVGVRNIIEWPDA